MSFDFTTIQPIFHTILNVAKPTVLQCYVIDEETEEIYTSQLIGTIPDGVAETYTLSRLDKYGKLLDSMDIKYGGHGTSFGLEREGGTVYIWSNYDSTDSKGATIKQDLVRFPYTPGKTLTYSDQSVKKYNKFNSVYTIPVIDQKNGRIALRYTNSLGNQIVELRNISDIKKNVNKVLGSVIIPTDLSYLQGITIDNYDLYWRVGDTNAVKYPDEISLFSFIDGSLKKRISCNVGKNVNGVFENNFREPEGIYLYTDKISGKKSLFVSVVTGGTSKRIIKSYAYHEIGNGEKFIGDMMTGVQKAELTSSNGKAKSTPFGVTLLSLIKQPGVYYISTSESNTFTDHPEQNTSAGWFMEVAPNSPRGDTYQILRKNVTTGTSMKVYFRVVSYDGTTSPWKLMIP